MHFSTLISNRRSCRSFNESEVQPEQVQAILRAALLAPSSMNRQSWHFIVVDDKTSLAKLSDSKEHGSHFLKDAALAVVVTCNPVENDCWVEDGAIRGRRISDGTLSSDIVKGILDIPEEQQVLCIVAIGNKHQQLPPHADEDLPWEKVHVDKF